MSKKILKMIIFLLFACTNMWGQRNFREGYIINKMQDTIYGWIDYRSDTRNARTCSFKKTEIDKITVYTPTDIVAYRFIDGKFYISKDIGGVNAPNLVFLEYLVKGLANMYYYRDNRTNDYYFIEKDDQFIELTIDEREIVIDGKNHIKTVNSYIGQLKALLNVWEMNDMIDKAKLDRSSMIDIARDFHNLTCIDGTECIVYEKNKPFVTMQIAPVVGFDLSTLKMTNKNLEGKYNQIPSTNLTVGVNMNFSMPRLNENLFLQLQTMYTKYYFFDIYESSLKMTNIHITANVLQIGSIIKYEYPKGKLRPTMGVGASAIWVPDISIEENADIHTMGGFRPSTVICDLPYTLLIGFEIIPGVHYYLTPKQTLFFQMHYRHCQNRDVVKDSYNKYASFDLISVIRSFGLSAGIYF